LLAQKYFHSTARQAALVARDAGVDQLLLGHYSSRYEDENVLLREAQEVFPNTRLTDEQAIFDV
jgi:ribonuclease Z